MVRSPHMGDSRQYPTHVVKIYSIYNILKQNQGKKYKEIIRTMPQIQDNDRQTRTKFWDKNIKVMLIYFHVED